MRALMAIGLAAALAVRSEGSDHRAEGRRPGAQLQAAGVRRQDLQASDFKGKKAVVVAWFPKAFTHGCTIECKSLAENGDKIKMYDVAYFMASVDPLEENTKFAKATRVTLGRARRSTRRKPTSRCSAIRPRKRRRRTAC